MTHQHIHLASGAGPTFGVDDLACAAATHLGIWENIGLTVEWTPALGGMKAMGMVLNGQVDAAYGGLGPVIHLHAENQPLKIVASMARALAQNLVVQPHIRSTADLKGATWAVDGIGALSHHMARSIVAALPISDDDITWRVTGPPPERIAELLSGAADASLIRVEEAIALTDDPENDLRTLLGFSELKDLVPLQPHGVLATTQQYIDKEPEALHKLAKGIILASRALNDDFDAFLRTFEHYVTVQIAPQKIEAIWQQEQQSGGFAVEGELSAKHWDGQIAAYAKLNPQLPKVERSALLQTRFVEQALREI